MRPRRRKQRHDNTMRKRSPQEKQRKTEKERMQPRPKARQENRIMKKKKRSPKRRRRRQKRKRNHPRRQRRMQKEKGQQPRKTARRRNLTTPLGRQRGMQAWKTHQHPRKSRRQRRKQELQRRKRRVRHPLDAWQNLWNPAAESDSQSCLGSLCTLLKGQEQMMAQTLASLAMNKQDSQTESQLLASCL